MAFLMKNSGYATAGRFYSYTHRCQNEINMGLETELKLRFCLSDHSDIREYKRLTHSCNEACTLDITPNSPWGKHLSSWTVLLRCFNTIKSPIWRITVVTLNISVLYHICSGGVRHSWVLGTPHVCGPWINPYKGIPVNVSLCRLSLARSTTNGNSFIVARQPVIGTKFLGCLHVLPRTWTAVSGQQ